MQKMESYIAGLETLFYVIEWHAGLDNTGSLTKMINKALVIKYYDY